MPRVTRAALRSNALLEDALVAASTPLPLTPRKERVALGEITDNQMNETPELRVPEETKETGKWAPSKAGPSKGKKGKGAKKGKKQVMKTEEVNVEILEDDNQSETSSAVEEACQDLMKESSGEVHQVVMHDQRPKTPPSPAVRALQKVLSRPQTPRFDPKVHKLDDTITNATSEKGTDDFSEAIIARSPVKLLSYDVASEGSKHTQMEDDAPLSQDEPSTAQPESVSPTKSTARIEDSVEALDAFEEEIEKIGELLPAMDGESHAAATDVTMDKSKVAAKVVGKPTSAGGRKSSTNSKPATTRTNVAKAIRKETSPKSKPVSATRSTQPAIRKSITAAGSSRTSSVKPAVNSRASIKPTASTKTSPTLSATKAPLTTHTRVTSLQKPPFQPTKSSKPPTRSTFSLPGEAVSRKLKEQREERLKQETLDAEQEPQKKSFKARRVRLSCAPVAVKATATSMARMSLAKGEGVAPKTKLAAPRDSLTTAAAGKRLSSLSVAKHAPTSTLATTKPLPSHTSSITSRTSPATATRPGNAPATITTGVRQTSRGKEVFGRTKAELEAREKEKREKEEAARRARAEAAERGRLASRAWAEKMRAKRSGVTVEKGTGEGERAEGGIGVGGV